MRHLIGLIRGTYLTFPDWDWVGSGDKDEGNSQLLIKSWPFGADYDRSYCLASWIAIRGSKLASCKCDL